MKPLLDPLVIGMDGRSDGLGSAMPSLAFATGSFERANRWSLPAKSTAAIVMGEPR